MKRAGSLDPACKNPQNPPGEINEKEEICAHLSVQDISLKTVTAKQIQRPAPAFSAWVFTHRSISKTVLRPFGPLLGRWISGQ